MKYVSLCGFYQSSTSEGYNIQISVQPEDKSFVEYINNREVNSGTYEALSDKKYKLVGDNRTIEIDLTKNNSFEVIIKKLNDEKPIVLKNVNEAPVYYSTKFNDIDKYKALLEE